MNIAKTLLLGKPWGKIFREFGRLIG